MQWGARPSAWSSSWGVPATGFMLVNERIADGTPAPRDGWSEVSRRPGLGITVDEKALGAPLFSIT